MEDNHVIDINLPYDIDLKQPHHTDFIQSYDIDVDFNQTYNMDFKEPYYIHVDLNQSSDIDFDQPYDKPEIKYYTEIHIF